MAFLERPLLHLILASLLLGGCGGEPPPNPAAADTTYGAAVAAADALPASAVAAEPDRYLGRRVSVDGRITKVWEAGCAFTLDTGVDTSLVVEAARGNDGECEWVLPPNTDGIAATTGPLRVAGDTLRLSANGVQVTPVRISKSDP